jgi:hypothetical protein
VRPIVKPLASKHHAEIQRITDQACTRFPDLSAMDAALQQVPTRDELAHLAFAWAKQVLSLGGWGWWSVSSDGKLSPALVSWNKAWWLEPVDRMLTLASEKRAPSLLLETVRGLGDGEAGTLKEIL